MNPELEVKHQLAIVSDVEQQLATLTEQLSNNPEFIRFLELQKQFKELEANVWQRVESVMVENDIKSIKTDRLTLTIAERLNFEVDPELLPSKFYKKVVNTKKLADTYRLEGRAPKGATPKITRYLVKRIKEK